MRFGFRIVGLGDRAVVDGWRQTELEACSGTAEMRAAAATNERVENDGVRWVHGEIPKWLNGADCKSAGLWPTEVRILLSPPARLSGGLGREGQTDDRGLRIERREEGYIEGEEKDLRE